MFNLTIILLVLSLLIVTYLINYTNKYKKKTKVHMYIFILFIMLDYWILCMLSQAMLISRIDMEPVYFEYFTGVVAVYIPVIVFMISLTYFNNKLNTKNYRWLYILPTIILISLWTNDIHNSFYINYSTFFKYSENGIFFIINAIHSYILFGLSAVILLKKSYMKSGFLSKQTIFLVLGFLVPITINILGSFKIVNMSVYISPILFSYTAVCFSLAIIRFKALNVIPVAYKTIFDTMQDSFVVISEDGTIADNNKTFEKTFENILFIPNKDNLIETIKITNAIDYDVLIKYLNESKKSNDLITKDWNTEIENTIKYFKIDIQAIKAKSGNDYVASLFIFRDITNEKKEIEMLTKKENLLILGELAGGMAHDINTPISSINMCIKTMERTISDDFNKELLKSMEVCTSHIIGIVNSLRDQIRNIGDKQKQNFSINKILENVQIMTSNELANGNCKLEINSNKEVEIFGEANKLTQVIINIVINAVQAYLEKNIDNKVIIINVSSDLDNNIIEIKDFAGGIPERIKPFIFKEILTTKGTTGTGIGMYISYSIVKGVFGGNITFESIEGVGTTFNIYIPKSNKEELNK